MLDIVISAITVLVAAVTVSFLTLLTLNIVLVRKLRSIIPRSPDVGTVAETRRVQGLGLKPPRWRDNSQ